MQKVSITNLSFTVDGLGCVTVDNDGGLNISKDILNALNSKEVNMLVRRTFDAINILTGDEFNTPLFKLNPHKAAGIYEVFYSLNGRKKSVAMLIHQHLYFLSEIPEWIKNLCMEDLKQQNIYFY